MITMFGSLKKVSISSWQICFFIINKKKLRLFKLWELYASYLSIKKYTIPSKS